MTRIYTPTGFHARVASDALEDLPRKQPGEDRPRDMTEKQRAWCASKWPWFSDGRRVIRAQEERG